MRVNAEPMLPVYSPPPLGEANHEWRDLNNIPNTKRIKSIVKAATVDRPRSRSVHFDALQRPATAYDEVLTVNKPTGRTLGLNVLLQPQPLPGATIYLVYPDSVAWRAGLRVGDSITEVITSDGHAEQIEDGHAATVVLPAAHGQVHLRVRRRPWTRNDQAASVIVAAMQGMRTRSLLRRERTAANRWQNSPIRSPPRLSIGDDD